MSTLAVLFPGALNLVPHEALNPVLRSTISGIITNRHGAWHGSTVPASRSTTAALNLV